MYRVTNALLCYDRIYMIDPTDTEPVDDTALCGAEEIILYMADDTLEPEAAASLLGKDTVQPLWSRDMYTVYCVK